jgi:branched-chain amino acid transport system permease protein
MTYALLLAFFRNDMGFGGNNGLTDFKDILGFNIQAQGTRAALFFVTALLLILSYVLARWMVTTAFGKVLIAVRDAESRTRFLGYRVEHFKLLVFTVSAAMAGIAGALYAHYLFFVSVEAFNILFSIQFLAMVIIGGLGSVMGSLMGAAFMVLMPEGVQALADMLAGGWIDRTLKLGASISFLREMAIGAAIIIFLVFEPDGLAHRWKQIKAYWKLYPFSH